jgi:hypothetical protein
LECADRAHQQVAADVGIGLIFRPLSVTV